MSHQCPTAWLIYLLFRTTVNTSEFIVDFSASSFFMTAVGAQSVVIYYERTTHSCSSLFAAPSYS